ncbi:twinkle protein, mitochondrial [Strongylocentrotus purpuratus]|uniref:DNA 5'-3' helicase n=1 Tax=Strongylocentrotus purpuratus TaxID=7668 RepID=A0A7M7P3E4_STRPU|nr:twinkle protein, mitochondrial [Strongylocentrotus purpuratus]
MATKLQRLQRGQHFLGRTLFTAAVAPRLVKFNTVEVVSSPSLSEIRKFFKDSGCQVSTGYTCLKLTCPYCVDPEAESERGAKSKEKQLFVNMTTGHCQCQCSRVCSSWSNLTDSLAIAKRQTKKKKSAPKLPKEQSCDQEWRSEVKNAEELWEKGSSLSELRSDSLRKLKDRFGAGSLSTETFDRFCARTDAKRKTLLLPQYGPESQHRGTSMVETCKQDPDEPEDSHLNRVQSTVIPRDFSPGLFGFHLVQPQHTEIILTANELDAMAVSEVIGQSALALPRGTAYLPQEVLPLLEQFQKIVLWFGNDMRSWEAAKSFARKLNLKRCYFIRPLDAHPGPLQALTKGLSLKTILRQATPMSHKSIVSFRALRDEVLGELSHAEQVAGVKWKRYPLLNKHMKGHRRGELTVFTGPTGSGKTTFMAEYSLDLCMQGVNTLWGSFEIQNVRLAKIMLTQFSMCNLEKNIDKFDRWADKFELLPLHFMTFHGQQSLKTVIDAMAHSVYVHDIEHVILDNLQFMVGVSERQLSVDRFAIYDNLIAAFRKFATENSCHVSVVIHPRKEKESDELQTASIFGSAKASQEADNVLILQDRRMTALKGRKYIQVVKNRFDGDLGIIPLTFNKETLTMSPPVKQKAKRPTKKEKEGEDAEKKTDGDEYELFEGMMLKSKSETEIGIGE